MAWEVRYIIIIAFFISAGCSTGRDTSARNEVGFVSQKGLEAALEDPEIKKNAQAIGANEPEIEALRDQIHHESRKIDPDTRRQKYQFTGPRLGVATRP